MLTVNSEVKKIYGKTEGKVHSKTGVSPIEFNSNNQGLISWSMLGNGQQASSQTYSLTEQPPISFNADGNPLASWSMLGNGQQTGTPTPYAPIMPEFVGVRTGNLFDKYGTKTAESLTYKYTISGLTPNAPYTCSTDLVGNKKLGASIYFNGGSSMGNGVWSDSPRTANSNESGEVVVYVRTVQTPETNPAVYNDLMSGKIWIMLNIGSTALPYEPFGYKIQITNAGQTAPVYLGQTQTVRKVKKLVLTGAEGWNDAAGSGDARRIALNMPSLSVGLCSHYAFGNAQIPDEFDLAHGLYLRFNINGIATTRDEWKSYLAQQYSNGTPVCVWYVLAEPETAIVNEPLCKIGDYADELHSSDTTVTIPTQNGSNTLTIGSTLQPSSMAITTASSVYPKNPIMPEFCGERTGNLAPPLMEWVDGYIASDGSVQPPSAGQYNQQEKYSPMIPVSASATYKFSCDGGFPKGESYAWKTAALYDSTGTFISRLEAGTSADPFTLNTNATTAFVRLMCRTYGESLKLMLNAGDTALPYEPYGWKLPITCAGQTTPVYLGQVSTVRRIKKLVLTGEEKWWTSGTYTGAVYAYHSQFPGIIPLTPLFCTHLVDASASSYARGTCKNDSNSVGLWIFDTATSPTAFKSYLAAQYAAGTPVTVWYVLAEPQTAIVNEPLAKIDTYADELHSEDTTVAIPTQNGANTISVDSTIPPSSLTIQYTSPDMSEIVRAVDGQGKPLYGPRYGFKIDKSQTNSASAIIYTHDAVTMTPAYMDYTNGSFNYGSWGNAWFVKEAKPVALNLDGTIAYYLDPDDYTKKIDGTNSDIFYTLLTTEPSDWSTQWKQYYHLNNGEYVLNDDAEAPTFAANTYYKLETSFTGNFMVQFPKVYFKRYEDENYNYVEVSDRKIGRDFKAYAHMNANGDELDFIYLPMFKGVIKDSKLRSIPGVIPQGGTTASTEVTAAEACGTGWQIWDHSSREMINDLLVLMSKNADSQAKFGKGRESGYNASDTVTYGKLQTGTLIKKGAFYGYNTSYSDVKVFHIEGSWANRWERLQGLLLVDGAYKIKMAPPYNFTGTDFVTLTTASPTSNNYVRTLATSEYGSVPATVSAYASSPFKDYFYQNQSGTRIGLVGGACSNGSGCGPRYVNLIYAASASTWYFGASAIYK